MAILAGQKVTAAALNRLQPVEYFAQASALLTRTDTTFADIPGATVTFDTTTAGASYSVIGVFDCAVGAAGGTTRMLGRIVTDGVAESGFAIHEMDDVDRDTVTTMALGTLGAAGSYTIKLQGALSGALATGGTFQTFTQIKVIVTEVP